MNYLDNRINFLVENFVATSDEVTLVTNIMGLNEESLDSIVYARLGYQTFEQWFLDEFQGDLDCELATHYLEQFSITLD